MVELRPLLRSEERRVVVDGRLVGTVVIVGQQVKEVKVTVERADVEALRGVFQGGGDGHGEEETRLTRALGLELESLAEFLLEDKRTKIIQARLEKHIFSNLLQQTWHSSACPLACHHP